VVNFRVDFHCLGPDDEVFSVEVHHGGFFCGSGADRVYLDGRVDWFDHVKVKYWSFTVFDEITLLLGYDLGVPVFWLLPELDLSTGLRLIESNKEAQIMKQVAFKVKNYVLYMDHYNTVDDNKFEDIVLNPIATLPAVISHRKMHVPSDGDDSEASSDVDFVDSDYAVDDDDDDDLFCDNIDEGVIDEGASKGIVVRAGRKRFAPPIGTDNDPAGK